MQNQKTIRWVYAYTIVAKSKMQHLVEEVKDIAAINKWKYQILESSFPNDALDNEEHLESLYGISFTPPNCETVSITFLSNGVMVCPGAVIWTRVVIGKPAMNL